MTDLKPVFVHPKAICDSTDIGPGTTIWAFTHVMPGVHIGTNCNIAEASFIETGAWIGDRVTIKNKVVIGRGTTIEDEVFVGPGVIFPDDRVPRSPRMQDVAEVRRRYSDMSHWLLKTRVCRGATLGAGVVVTPGITIEEYAFIAAGSVVTKTVQTHRFIGGNPGRPLGWVCFCGNRLEETGQDTFVCSECGQKFRTAEHRMAAY